MVTHQCYGCLMHDTIYALMRITYSISIISGHMEQLRDAENDNLGLGKVSFFMPRWYLSNF